MEEKEKSLKQSKSYLKMQNIGTFIINNANENLDQILHHSVMQFGGETDMCLTEMLEELFDTIDETCIDEFQTFQENVGMQRMTLISFKFEGRLCEIGEHFGTQRDYFWVRIYALNM